MYSGITRMVDYLIQSFGTQVLEVIFSAFIYSPSLTTSHAFILTTEMYFFLNRTVNTGQYRERNFGETCG